MTDARPHKRSNGCAAGWSVLRSNRWIWIAAIWCAGALFDASQTILTMHAMGSKASLLSPFLSEFLSWLPWALATPFIAGLARKLPIARGAVLKAGVAHLAAFAIVGTVAGAVVAG